MKQKLTVIVALIIIFQNFLFTKEVFPWTEDTHGNLSIYAAENSVLNKNKGDYLKNLGFNKELLEEFKWNNNKRTVKDWIDKGAEFEDKSDWGFPILPGSTTRSFNHFHNPLKLWSQAGLDDFWTGESSLLWAQDGTNQNNFPDGDWSWQAVRNYYYLALTSTTDTVRQEYFASIFTGLGHQIHLIQDAAQPDHVRNDAHPEDTFSGVITPIGFEKWAGKNKSYINSLASNPIFPSLSLDPSQYTLDSSYYTRNLVPSALFLDTDQYDGLNASAGINQGLAEYTNANFFSDDTIFAAERYPTSDGHYSPYPKKSSTDLQSYIDENKLPEVVIGEDNIPDTSFWIKKERDGESIIEHFVKPGYFTRYINPFIALYYRTFYRDEKCHEEYATKLIPRAVGYSAGLLDYFFRGTLEITPPAQVAYAVTDGSQTPYVDNYGNYHQQFTSIKAKVRNSTPDTIPGEEVQNCNQLQENCILHAVARYKIIPNYQNNLSNYPPDGTTMQNIEYSYSLSEPKYIDSLSSTTPQEFTFYFTNDPIPAGITDLHLFIVFKGTLGNETDIAIAVGMKDLMEPTHQVFWNLTDMFSLDNHLYTSDTIKTTPALADRVDFDNDGIFNETNIGEPYIDPHAMTFGIGYLKEPPGPVNPFTYSAITVVQPGRHIRLVVLVDKPQNNYLVLEESDAVSGNSYYYFASPGVINQEENGVWQTPTPITTFRYGLDIDGVTQIPIRQHYYTGVIGCYPIGGTDPYGNPVCSYPESEAIPAEVSPSPIDTVYFP